ncbi:hypothetical protein QA584_26535 [Anaerocolumna sp. AGMB13025]|uniref:hypothetical protein n=1 Tax=Anaerocolumna sp. AGMB13025 TaxID=3039116 RepID=UPI00241FEF70|nr:hypothetical protein [Anaerocolumna sp. AGMB13025]WFR57126.1 hypothetical protein QA584_26535 [Anaerocolumna sp. AGMB13025]
MYNELSFDLAPLIKSYQYYSYPLSILKCNNSSNYEYCLLNNFKTIFFAGNLQFYVDEYDFWNVFKIETMDILDRKNVQKDIINAIDNYQYIHLTCIDEYYIPSRFATYKNHNLHDILIIGYENDELITVGYNDKGEYNKEKIKVNLLVNSLTAITKSKLIKINETKLELDYKDILDSLNVYFTSKKMLKTFKTTNTILDFDSWVYGINSMGKMILNMRKMENDFLFNNLLLCIECKQLILVKMQKIIVYLKNPQLLVEYQEILKKYEIIRFKIFKKIIKTDNFIDEIDLLEKVYCIEKQFAEKWVTGFIK